MVSSGFTGNSVRKGNGAALFSPGQRRLNQRLFILLGAGMVLNLTALLVFGIAIGFNSSGLSVGILEKISDTGKWVAVLGILLFSWSVLTVFLAIGVRALVVSSQKLNHRLGTLEQEKEEMAAKLVQAEKYRALGILAGSVAHDLNNILSGIATYPEVLLMDKTLDPGVRQGLDLIKDSGRKASAVVSDLLTISRGAVAEKEIININLILDRYTSAPDFDKIRKTCRPVEVEILMEPELLNIRGSYIHIEKIIMNLFLNAVEALSDRQGGEVVITTANRYIGAGMPGYEDMVPGEYVLLSVDDNGPGIDEILVEKIFEPFFTKKKMGKSGTGLGLTVVWNAVQNHQGTIKVRSSDRGTGFDLFFPAVREQIPQKAATESLEEIRGQGQTILVVDDLKDQQKIAVSILENLGYQARSVDDGYSAVEFIKHTPTDLVILDMVMAPSISGLKTYEMIKEIKPDQKAIITSGYSESEEVLMAMDLGAGSFIKKPYTILDMGIAVKEELGI